MFLFVNIVERFITNIIGCGLIQMYVVGAAQPKF